MSQISRARQRLMSKNRNIYEFEEELQGKTERYPRKFTLSSLTQNMDKKSRVESSPMNNLPSRTQTMTPLEAKHLQLHLNFSDSKNQINFNASSKDQKTRRVSNYKIQQNLVPHSPIRLHKNETSFEREDTIYEESPIKILNKKLLHGEKINLIIAPPHKRFHGSPFKPRECSKEVMEGFIAEKLNQKQCFVDETFPPERTIIFNKKVLYQEEGLKFERLSRIFEHEMQIVKYSEPTLLTLGKYTNSHLYSALAILSEDPARILNLFGGQDINQEGIYYVNLCKDGVWRYIIIDDFMPIKNTNKKQLLFIHSKQRQAITEIWPSLLEKAIAKIYGTYLDLALLRNDGIVPLFRILTGSPVSQYTLNKDFRAYLILIDTALKKKHIVVLEGILQDNQQTAFLKNMSVNQSYKLVQLKKNCIHLRNLAESELITKLSFEEALIFTKLAIFRVEPSYVYKTQKLRHKKQYFSIGKMMIKCTSKCYFDVWENNPAYYKKHLGSNIQYSVSPYKILINKIKISDEKEDEIDEIQADPGKEIELPQGQYLVTVHLCQQKEQDFTLSYYGDQEPTFERIKNMDKWERDCRCNNRPNK